MSDSKRGQAFTLSEISRSQSKKTWFTLNEVFIDSPGEQVLTGWNYGYFHDNGTTNVYRYDISNDTSTTALKAPSPLKASTQTGNNQGEYGYAGSGRIWPGGDKTSKTERLDYANDTLSMVEKGDLEYETYWGAGSNSNNDYGYWAGGYHPGTQPWNNTYLTSNSRIDFSNDTSTALSRGKLSVGRYDFGSTFCNKNYGYWAGGMTGGYPAGWGITRVDRLDYSSDTTGMSVKYSLADSRARGAGSGNKDYGYIMGGQAGSSPYDGRTEITRMDYSNDGVAPAPKGNLYRTLVYCSAVGDADYGYIGGKDKADNVVNSYFQRVDYANDTATALPKGVALGINPFGSGANGSFSFSGMNYNLASNTFMATKIGGIPVGTNYGYWVGGTTPEESNSTKIDRIDYDNDSTNMVSKGNLAQGRRHSSASSNTNYTWVSGGDSGSPSWLKVTYVDRIDYSNDTATALARGNTTEHGYASATGNQNHGYTFGGQVSSSPDSSDHVTTISRIDYTNDGVQALSRGNTNIAARMWASGGNEDYAYLAGGIIPGAAKTSVTQRMEYAIDNTAMVTKGDLSMERSACTAVTNDRYMYVCGGTIPGSPGFSSSTERIDYYNDTSTAVTKANLAVTKRYSGGATNKISAGDFGYTAGGSTPGGLWSITDRIDFSNDTTTAVTKGTLTVETERCTGSSSKDDGLPLNITNPPKISLGYLNRQTSNSGYINGGVSVPSVQNASYYKYDFDNDTNAVAVRGYSPYTNRSSHTALNSGLASYWCGGDVDGGDAGTLVDRFEYANDSGSLTPKGNLAIAVKNTGSNSNDNAVSDGSGYGFIGGGLRLISPASYASSSHIQRIDYANDTSICEFLASILPGGYSGMFTVGTRSHGYWAGGYEAPNLSTTTIRRLDYSNTTVGALFRSSMDIEQNGVTGDSGFQSGGSLSSHTHGYFVGGGSYNGGTMTYRDKVIRYDFSNDLTVAAPRCTNGSNSTGTSKAGMGNESYGYTVGGFNSNITPERITNINRLDYANDTSVMITKSFTLNEVSSAAAISARDRGYGYVAPLIEDSSAKSVSNMYALDGENMAPNPDVGTSNIYQIRQENSTVSTVPKGNWSEVSYATMSYASKSRAYRVGGLRPGSSSRIDRIEFANDTTTSEVATLTKDLRSTSGMSSNGGTYGWVIGGLNYSYFYNSAERMDFSNETNALVPGVSWTHSAYYQNTASGGNQDYGYWAGGIRYPSPSYGTYKVNQRLDFSNNTMKAMPNLPTWRMGMGGMSTKDYAYFAGGSYPGYKSTVWRISYASDTETMVEKGPLPDNRVYLSAASNQDYGFVWYGHSPNPGASTQTSTVYRINFSNDTAQADFVANLPNPRTQGSGASSSDHGI